MHAIVWFVTGTSRGFGLEIARAALARGDAVVAAARDPQGVHKALGGHERLLGAALDVTVGEQVEAAVERFGRIDTMVDNAGMNLVKSVSETSDEDWRACMGSDLDGVFYLMRAALPHLVATKGSIVNVGSVSSLGGGWSHAAYCAAKAAVANLSKAVAIDMGADGVRVNTVCPGLTDTPMVDSIMGNEAILNKGLERIPMKRMARPGEIASVIAFLASEDASYVTGAALPVDGGLVATDGGPHWAS